MTTPRQIGRYQVLGEIASGAQGAVYRAIDPSTSVTVAVKVLHQQHSANASFVERFRREASLIQSIDHENVIKILDFGDSDSRQFMAMEFIPETLSNLIDSDATRAFSLERAVALSVGIAEGIGQAHTQGIVHRDIKPQNVLLTIDGIPKLTDFGIARGEMLNTMTATGVMMGTPYYMSPEQANGERGDARSDVYSLGCLVYQLLSGDVPFSGDTPLAILRRHVEDVAKPLKARLPGIPDAVNMCVEQAMAKEPGQRFADGNAFALALLKTLPTATAEIPQQASSVEEAPKPTVTNSNLAPSQPMVPSKRSRYLDKVTMTFGAVAVVGLIAVAFLLGNRSADSIVVETVEVIKEVKGDTVEVIKEVKTIELAIKATVEAAISATTTAKEPNVAEAAATPVGGWTPLHWAAADNSLDVVRLLIDSGTDIDAKSHQGDKTPLHMAAQKNSLDSARLLIELGANIHAKDNKGETALLIAAQRNFLDFATLLIDSGADIEAKNKWDETSLHFAAENNSLDVARLLIDSGAELGIALGRAASRNSLEVATLLIDSGADIEYLHTAAQHNSLDVARLLIDRGADIESGGSWGCTPLCAANWLADCAACLDKENDVARLLVERGANTEGIDLSWMN
jgi:serine/threonine protein kinase